MMDPESAMAVESYVNAFPNNKIEMLGRRDVLVRRHDERRRTNVGSGSNDGVCGMIFS